MKWYDPQAALKEHFAALECAKRGQRLLAEGKLEEAERALFQADAHYQRSLEPLGELDSYCQIAPQRK